MKQMPRVKYKIWTNIAVFLLLQMLIVGNGQFACAAVLTQNDTQTANLSPKLLLNTSAIINCFRANSEKEKIDLSEVAKRPKYEPYYTDEELKAKIAEYDFFAKNIIASDQNKILWRVLNHPNHQHYQLIRNFLDTMVKHYRFIGNEYSRWPENNGKIKRSLFKEKGLDFDVLRPLLMEYNYVDSNNKINPEYSKISEKFKERVYAQFLEAKKKAGVLNVDFSGELPQNLK